MRRRDSSGWVTALFLTLAVVGWLHPWTEEPTPVRDCTPVTRQADRDPDAYDTLIGQGYRPEGDTLVPRGCEGTR